MKMNKFRHRVAAPAALAVLFLAFWGPAQAEETSLRIGYLRGSEPLNLSRIRGTLDQELAAKGVKVIWSGPFAAYAPAAEALNADAIDITVGSSTAAITSVAGDAPLSLFAFQWDGGDSSGLLVKKDSPIRAIADLRGKTVAVNRGGTGEYLLAKALKEAGIAPDRVTKAYLAPSDASAAFSQNRVDAWATWGTFFAAGQTALDARILELAKDFGSENAVVYVVPTAYAHEHPAVIDTIIANLQASAKWQREHPAEAAKIWETDLKLEPAVAQMIAGYISNDPLPIGNRELAVLDRTDAWMVEQKILPAKVDLAGHVAAALSLQGK